MVGVGGDDSDWRCELVVCVSDGLVWLGMARRDEVGELFAIVCDSCLGYSGRSMLRPYQCNPRVRVGKVISRQTYEHNIESARIRPEANERCRTEARRYESNIEGNDESSAEEPKANCMSDVRTTNGDENRRHGAEFCGILRLRLIPRLCCAVPLVVVDLRTPAISLLRKSSA